MLLCRYSNYGTLPRKLAALPSSLFFSTPCINSSLPLPISEQTPAAKKVPFTATVHGVRRQDPFNWMSNTHDPDFINYLHQENSYADAFMTDTHHLQRTLYSEMIARMPSEISTPPERWGPWLYYQYIPNGKEFPVLCRELASMGKGWMDSIVNYVQGGSRKEEILLDWNQIADEYGYVHVGTCRVSPDHNFLAYTLDISGAELFMLQIKDLRNGYIRPEYKTEGVVSLAWSQDSSTLFYTLSDKNQRPYRVQCTKVGSNSGDQVPLFVEKDPSFCVDIASTKDGKFITVNSNSRTSSEVYVINAVTPQAGLRRFCKRDAGVQYFLEHHYGFFYVLTNARGSADDEFTGGGNYYLARCRVEDMQSNRLQTIIVPSEDICLQDMDIFNEHLVLLLNKEGSSSICSINLPIGMNCEKPVKIDDLNPWFFPVPSDICSIAPGSNHDFMNSVYRVVLSSPVMPDLIVDYDMSQKTFSIVQQEKVNNIIAGSQAFSLNHERGSLQENKREIQKINKWKWEDLSEIYACERKHVISLDGVAIPLTILYSKREHKKGQSPGLLCAYGAYGEVLEKSWCTDRLSLLDRGWVVAFADVRGGSGGPDPSWHSSGSQMNKLSSIYDFVSCGLYLVSEGYVHKGQLGAVGNSAGCVLVGAAMNMHPELFGAVILKVPFVDVCNTLLDPDLPLSLLDYEEFGNPQIQEEFQYIMRYSPYENIPRGICCPAMLVTAALNDSRVGVWEAAKWVAKLRDTACPSCSRSVILTTNMSGGHFGEGGLYGQCEETSYEYAFLMKVLGNCKDE